MSMTYEHFWLTNGSPWGAAPLDETIVVFEPFTGPDSAAWSGTWMFSTSTGAAVSLANRPTLGGAGRLSASGQSPYVNVVARNTTVPTDLVDFEWLVRFRRVDSVSTEGYVNFGFRANPVTSEVTSVLNDGYFVEASGLGPLTLYKRSGGAGGVALGSSPVSMSTSAFTWVRIRAVGSTISFKAWNWGTLEPVGWDASVTDTTHGSGLIRMHVANGGASTVVADFDDFSVIDLTQIEETSFAKVQMLDEPVALWRMDDLSGSATDIVTRTAPAAMELNGTVALGAPSLLTTETGSIRFSGPLGSTTNTVTSHDPRYSPLTNGNGNGMTWEMVVKNASVGLHYLVAKGKDGFGYEYGLYVNENGALIPVVWGPGGSNYLGAWASDGLLPLGESKHLVWTVSADFTSLIYVDGTLVHTLTPTGPDLPAMGTARLMLGNRDDVGAYTSFQGDMQNVALYDKVLTPTQIQEHYIATGLDAPSAATFAAFGIPL